MIYLWWRFLEGCWTKEIEMNIYIKKANFFFTLVLVY